MCGARVGHSKYVAKQAQGWTPGQAITNWLREQYPEVKLFCGADREIVAEYLGEKSTTYTPDTMRTLLATLKKLQEGLRAMNWIHEEVMPQEWVIEGRNPPRGPYAPDDASAMKDWIRRRGS